MKEEEGEEKKGNDDVDDVGKTGVGEGEEVAVEDGGVEKEEGKEDLGVAGIEEEKEEEGYGVPNDGVVEETGAGLVEKSM